MRPVKSLNRLGDVQANLSLRLVHMFFVVVFFHALAHLTSLLFT